MARFAFKAGEDFAVKLSQLAAKTDEVAIKAVKRGAGLLADEVRSKLEALPEDRFRKLPDGEGLYRRAKRTKA